MQPLDKQGTAGDFYVQEQWCTLCLLTVEAAPHLMSLFESPEGPVGPTCSFSRQPETDDEVDAAIRAMKTSCCEAVRYRGRSPTILGKLGALGLARLCDYPG
jgi:hypothetical protein